MPIARKNKFNERTEIENPMMKAAIAQSLNVVRVALGVSLLSIALHLPSAHAYLDPGTMGMALQVVVAAVAGGFLFFKSGFYKIKGLFAGKGSQKSIGNDKT